MSLILKGEIRGITEFNGIARASGEAFRRVYVHVESTELDTYQVELSRDNIAAGFDNQLAQYKGRICYVPLSCNAYKDKVQYRYSGNNLPREAAPSKVSASASK